MRRWMVILALIVAVGFVSYCSHKDRIRLYTKWTSRGLNYKGGDITIKNARIWTGDPADPWKSAMTIKNGEIVAMNADKPSGKVIDAEGRLILPGFCDGHCHPQTPYVLVSPEAPTLFHCKTPEEVLDEVRKYVEEHPEDKYPRMFGWEAYIFEEGVKPTRQMLDEVIADKPCYLVHHSGHVHWANTRALELAGILYETPPEMSYTGHIERDPETGMATGYLSETELGSTAGVLLNTVKKVQPYSFEEVVLIQRMILEMYAETGVTSIHTKDGDPDIVRIYMQILEDDALPVRAVMDNLYTPWNTMEDFQQWADLHKQIQNSDLPKGFLKANGVKLMVDLPVHTWMFEPYANDPENAGKEVWKREEILNQMLTADRLGLTINLLTMGDRAVHEALNLLDDVNKLNPPRPRRHTLEHAEFIKDEDIPRIAEMGVLVVMNPTFSYPLMDYQHEIEATFGKERMDKEYQRWKDLIASGVYVVCGSDFPLTPMDPLLGIHVMVTGADKNGLPEGGLWPHKNTTVEDALRTYTTNAAYGSFDEARMGYLKVGYVGDFVMLSENILDPAFDTDRLIKVKPMLTVFNGHIIHKDLSEGDREIDFGSL